MSSVTIGFMSQDIPKAGALALVVAEGKLGPIGQSLDKVLQGAISTALKVQGFKGKAGESLTLLAPSCGHDSLTIISIGAAAEADDVSLEKTGAQLYLALAKLKAKDVGVLVDLPALRKAKTEPAALLASGAALRSYRFDKYRTQLKADDKPQLATLNFHVKAAASVKKAYAALAAVVEAVSFTRDLMNEPPNVLYPESYADRIADLKKLGLKITVLKAAEIKKLKMGALYGVAQGSAFEPRVVSIEWQGDPKAKNKSPLALLGKGVTFDTGGVSIKPAAGMDEMKFDMGGSAAVVGTLMALALRKAKVNVVGVVGLVENAVDGNAQRPGDIVTSMSGKTIEVLNTDAEGRLVLADVLTYAQRTFKPSAMIDLATLTGACIVALGHEHAAVLANDDKLAAKLQDAGKKSGETVWQLPLGEAYDSDINSSVADMKNIGSGRDAGTIIGAHFIGRFVENDTPWAHLDIAGTAWISKDKVLTGKGATGYGVRLLNRLIADHFER